MKSLVMFQNVRLPLQFRVDRLSKRETLDCSLHAGCASRLDRGAVEDMAGKPGKHDRPAAADELLGFGWPNEKDR